ncbi:hypothetical protein C8J56DRAFT_888508 [Mycena floridula]|nr:hypothetical protein C8J56DRAFT_888508 [Mycena floridula]
MSMETISQPTFVKVDDQRVGGQHWRYIHVFSLSPLLSIFGFLQSYGHQNQDAASTSDSEDEAEVEEDDDPEFSGRIGQSHIHTHAPIANVLYHLGASALVITNAKKETYGLLSYAAEQWCALTSKEVKKVLKKHPVIKIRIKKPVKSG